MRTYQVHNSVAYLLDRQLKEKQVAKAKTLQEQWLDIKESLMLSEKENKYKLVTDQDKYSACQDGVVYESDWTTIK